MSQTSPAAIHVQDESWFMNLNQTRHRSPIFEWRFANPQRHLRVLRGYSCLGVLWFTDDKRSRDDTTQPHHDIFHSVVETLTCLDRHGWGRPPYIDEVFEDARVMKAKIPFPNIETAERVCNELWDKWSKLLIGTM